ncbi:MAG: S9 family peptidase [bacterium]|nr:S9 family peptidase [bacterium]
MRRSLISTLVLIVLVACATAHAEESTITEKFEQLGKSQRSMQHDFDALAKRIDDVLWYERVGDVAQVEKVRIYGPPRWKEDNPNGIGAGNPVKFSSYLFTPKDLPDGKLPLLVLPHGGIHADFTTYYAHIIRELIAQGYIVVAPEYRGSTGYGGGFYRLIDYGGKEVVDCLAARDWVVKNHPKVDSSRVGILGWSHGGLITLMSAFDYPDKYKCGFAGVPVSNLVMRMGYLGPSYQAHYDADFHIGETPRENLSEYKRRSPVWNAHKLTIPMRIHTNVNDEDVNYIEVEHLINVLKAEEKDFEYEVYDVPGGHSHDRLDTPEAWEAREEIYKFLARYLKPPRPGINLGLTEAGRAAP